MNLKEAFETVLDLANENALDPDLQDPDSRLYEIAKEQDEALGIVREYYEVNIRFKEE